MNTGRGFIKYIDLIMFLRRIVGFVGFYFKFLGLDIIFADYNWGTRKLNT